MSRAGSMATDSPTTNDRWPRMFDVCWRVPVQSLTADCRALVGTSPSGDVHVVWHLERVGARESVALCCLRMPDGREIVLARGDAVEWTEDPELGLLHADVTAAMEPGFHESAQRGLTLTLRVRPPAGQQDGPAEGNAVRVEAMYARSAAFAWLGLAGGRYEFEGVRRAGDPANRGRVTR